MFVLSILFFLQVCIVSSCSLDDGVSELLHGRAGYPSKTDRPLVTRPVETIEALLSGFDMLAPCTTWWLLALVALPLS